MSTFDATLLNILDIIAIHAGSDAVKASITPFPKMVEPVRVEKVAPVAVNNNELTRQGRVEMCLENNLDILTPASAAEALAPQPVQMMKSSVQLMCQPSTFMIFSANSNHLAIKSVHEAPALAPKPAARTIPLGGNVIPFGKYRLGESA